MERLITYIPLRAIEVELISALKSGYLGGNYVYLGRSRHSMSTVFIFEPNKPKGMSKYKKFDYAASQKVNTPEGEMAIYEFDPVSTLCVKPNGYLCVFRTAAIQLIQTK